MPHSYAQFFTDTDITIVPQAMHRFSHTNLEIAVFDGCEPPCLIGLEQPDLYNPTCMIEPHATIVQDHSTLAIHIYLPRRMSGHVFVRNRTGPLPEPLREHLLPESAHIQVARTHIINPFTPEEWQQIRASPTYRLGTTAILTTETVSKGAPWPTA